MTPTERAKPRKTKEGPTPVDGHVGARIRARRLELGMSQKKLGESVSLTFQQIQKYERGANRIGSGRLYEFSRILGVTVSYFFEGAEAAQTKKVIPCDAIAKAQGLPSASMLDKRETLDLVRAYYRIDSTKLRKRLFELVKAAAEPNQ